MLQIVTKMYFRQGVPLNSTVHRDVLYTNRIFLGHDRVDLPVGELAPSSGWNPVTSVTVSVTEHLEAERSDGQREILISTGGTELIDDLADVLSFGLNSTFSRDHDLVHRLVPVSPGQRGMSASSLFRGTFDPSLMIQDSELDAFRVFMTRLLALRRPYFEASMKAMTRIVRACRRAVEDPTIAYTDLVAALESLSEGESLRALNWVQVDGRKRKLIDAALTGADPGLTERVRKAIMQADRLGLKNGFVQFVMNRVSFDYYRAGAIDAIRPVRGTDLERAVRLAYDIRSRNVHTLWDLPAEAWAVNDRADTVMPGDLGIMLSLEGLARLARHVVRAYVERSPVGVDHDFDWRASLPGLMRMKLAPQYWIHVAGGFNHASVASYFDGFVANLLEVFADREKPIADMQGVLARIEELVPGTVDGDAKFVMIAIYAIWHRVMIPKEHRTRGTVFLAKYEQHLQVPSMPAFGAGFLTDRLPDWSVDDWEALAIQRRTDRLNGKGQPLPAGVDAALQVIAATHLANDGRHDDALTLARYAIEEMPSSEALIRWEAALTAGQEVDLDLRTLILGERVGNDPSETDPERPNSAPSETAAPTQESTRNQATDLDQL
jgi:hypothetical protein